MTLKEVIENAKKDGIEVERNGATYTFRVGVKEFTLKQVKGNIKIREMNNCGRYGFVSIGDEKLYEMFELLKIYR